jgi:hypothetical protein
MFWLIADSKIIPLSAARQLAASGFAMHKKACWRWTVRKCFNCGRMRGGHQGRRSANLFDPSMR